MLSDDIITHSEYHEAIESLYCEKKSLNIKKSELYSSLQIDDKRDLESTILNPFKFFYELEC